MGDVTGVSSVSQCGAQSLGQTNLAINALCDGTCLQYIELRRNDPVFLDALGAQSIPDPTTSGDFCRRFKTVDHIKDLESAIHAARLRVWGRQSPEFFNEAGWYWGAGYGREDSMHFEVGEALLRQWVADGRM